MTHPQTRPGDVVFFSEFSRTTKGRPLVQKFKPGHTGFAVFLGVVAPFQKEPTSEQVVDFMGTLGFISFDLVGRILGEDVLKELLARIHAAHEKELEKIAEKPKLIMADDGEPNGG